MLNQNVEQLCSSLDQTMSLWVGFILGRTTAELGTLLHPCE